MVIPQQNLQNEAIIYAQSNVKAPEFEFGSNRWLIRYTVNGVWTWMSCASPAQAQEEYRRLLEAKRLSYIQMNQR